MHVECGSHGGVGVAADGADGEDMVATGLGFHLEGGGAGFLRHAVDREFPEGGFADRSPFDGDGGRGELGDAEVDRSVAVLLHDADIVDRSGGIRAATTVIAPEKDQVVDTLFGKSESILCTLVSSGKIQFATEACPTGDFGGAESVRSGRLTREGVGSEFRIAGDYESTKVVVVALAVGFPVEADGVGARL